MRSPCHDRTMRRLWAPLLVLALAGWEPFRAPNANVEAGNKAYAAGEYDKAIDHYDRAAKDGGVDPAGLAYDRGSAQLKKAEGTTDPAQKKALTESGLESLKHAATSRDPRIRAQANYNRGNTLMGQDKLEDAIESYKQALKDQPSLDDARLNLELALKRRQKQQQQQQQGQGQGQQGQGQNQQQGQGQQQQGQGQQGQNQQQQQGQGQQGQNQQQQQGQGQQGQNQQQQQGQGQQQQQQQQGQGQGQGQQQQQQQGQGGGSQDQQQQDQNQQGQQNQQSQRKHAGRTHPQGPKTPTEGKLDDLEDFSRHLQRDGARRRASGRAKDPEKDW